MQTTDLFKIARFSVVLKNKSSINTEPQNLFIIKNCVVGCLGGLCNKQNDTKSKQLKPAI